MKLLENETYALCSDSGGWSIKKADHIQKGGLSRTRLAPDRDELTSLNIKINIREDPLCSTHNTNPSQRHCLLCGSSSRLTCQQELCLPRTGRPGGTG